jgi:hypothetical protein
LTQKVDAFILSFDLKVPVIWCDPALSHASDLDPVVADGEALWGFVGSVAGVTLNGNLQISLCLLE